MRPFPLLDDDQLSGDAGKVIGEYRREMLSPAVPNFMRVQAVSPTVLAGTWGVTRYILNRGILPRALKEMILAAISSARNCKYCESAHLAFLKMLGVDEATRQALLMDLDSVVPARTRDIIQFAVKCATDPAGLTDADYDSLREHGIPDQELMEIIGMAAFAAYVNILADAIKIEIDPMMAEILSSATNGAEGDGAGE